MKNEFARQAIHIAGGIIYAALFLALPLQSAIAVIAITIKNSNSVNPLSSLQKKFILFQLDRILCYYPALYVFICFNLIPPSAFF